MLVVVEDGEAWNFFHGICGVKVRSRYIPSRARSFGASIRDLTKKVGLVRPSKEVVFVLCDDEKEYWRSHLDTAVLLPGRAIPETVLFRYLFLMKEAHPFWESISNTYTRQFAIVKEGASSIEKGDDREWVKKWFNFQSKYWGRMNNKIYKYWVQEHAEECRLFCEALEEHAGRSSN